VNLVKCFGDHILHSDAIVRTYELDRHITFRHAAIGESYIF